MENYFEVLGLRIEDLQNQSEETIKTLVEDAHLPLYKRALLDHRPGAEERRNLLNEAKNTLIDPQRRKKYIEELPWPGNRRDEFINLINTLKATSPTITTEQHSGLLQQGQDAYGLAAKEAEEILKNSGLVIVNPGPGGEVPVGGGGAHPIFKFPNGDEATSIPQLATLMEKNSRDATEALYNNYIEQSLGRVGEQLFANAARAVVSQFSGDRSIGLMAMVAILRGKVRMQKGNDAGTPQQLARLIDQNWEQSKTHLYNGFIAFWLEYTKQTRLADIVLADIVKKITSTYSKDKNVGLEVLVQKLDPRIGDPKPEISHSEIDFGRMDTESQKTIDIQITNVGRGFLYGNVQLPTDMPGLQVSDTEIRGGGAVSVKLDASRLTPNKTHHTVLVFNTNGGMMRVPVSCAVILVVNTKDKDGKTPLHIAVWENDYEKVEALVKSGADVNAKDDYDNTPLHRAAYWNRSETAEVLLKNGAAVNAKDDYDNTPLHKAAYRKAREVAKVLLKNGAAVNAKDNEGKTPLHKAAKHNAREVAKVLLKNGAAVNAKNNDGKTPLHEAAYWNRSETAEVLLKNGAAVNAKNNDGKTPLHEAAYWNRSETAEVLLKNGAAVNAKNDWGETPLHTAQKENAAETVAVLHKHGRKKGVLWW